MANIVKRETRDGFGEALVRIARRDPNVVSFDCDLGKSTRAQRIAEVDPARFIDMGISEQDMVSTAAGLASMGKIAFVSSFSIFVTGRAFDQVRQQVSLPRANVKVCGSSAGLTLGADGATHQSIVDLALMRSLPYMTVVSPADARQAEAATEAAHATPGPFYLRLSRYPTPDFIPADLPFELGKMQRLRDGVEVAILSTGPVTYHAVEAADRLAAEGRPVAVYNVHTIKPLDLATLRQIAQDFRTIVTVEEHNIYGGLGGAVAEAVAELGTGVRVLRHGVRDTYGESASADELLAKHGLDATGIAARIREAASTAG
jgi:transketolase